MSTNLFKPGDLTHGEAEFISNVLKDDKTLDVGSLYMQRAQAIATLRLAKEIERSTASNNKASKAMNSLTGALVFVGALQAVILLINTFK